MANERRAAVAIIHNGDDTLLIKRKEFPGDPWSGHIAFPGGHIHDNETVEQGLLREIREEVNLEIFEAQISKRMEMFHPNRSPQLSVYPMVIEADGLEKAGKGPEVEDLRVVNLKKFVQTRHPDYGLPALDYNGWIVWGLTYRIIMRYLESME
jgi:8-oxo-dGTP diphosphatase